MDFEELHEQIANLFQCKRCERKLSPPVFCCNYYSHFVCQTCKNEVYASSSSCPDLQCSGFIIEDQQTLINDLVSTFPFKCKFSNLGCEKISNNLKYHERKCDYRLIKCVLLNKISQNCNDIISLPNYCKHVESYHDFYIIPYSLNSEYKFTLPRIGKTKMSYQVLKNSELYFLKMTYYDDQLKAYQISVHFIGKKSQASNYIYTVECIDTNIKHYKYSNSCMDNIMTPKEVRRKCPLLIFDEGNQHPSQNEIKLHLKIMKREDFAKSILLQSRTSMFWSFVFGSIIPSCICFVIFLMF